jgi:hypothetical protein
MAVARATGVVNEGASWAVNSPDLATYEISGRH